MQRGPSRFRSAVYGVIAGVTAFGALSGLAVQAANAATITTTNLYGSDRYQSAGISNAAAFPSGVNRVLLADGLPGHQSDALAASGYAGVAPQDGVLLTDNTNTVPANTMAALAKVDTGKNILVLGGASAVSPAQVAQLTSAGYTVTQPFQGTNRFQTMQMIDDSIAPSAVGTSGSPAVPTAILASGDDNHLVDALSAGGLAYAKNFPVILTESSSSTLEPEAQQVITQLGIKRLIIVGGTASIPASQYTPMPTGITQLDTSATTGADRSATSELLEKDDVANYGASSTSLFVAAGETYVGNTTNVQNDGADALSSAPFAGGFMPTCVSINPANPGSLATCRSDLPNLTNLYVGSGPSSFGPADLNAVGGSTTPPPAACSTSSTLAGSLPVLCSAHILTTVTTSSATPSMPAGTYVQYVFNQSVASDTPNPGGYAAYDYTGGRYQSTQNCATILNSSGVPSAACELVSKDPSNANAVDVDFYFPNGTAGSTYGTNSGSLGTGNNLSTASGASTLALATIAGPQSVGGPGLTVGNVSGNPGSPDGAAALNNTSTLSPGVTNAPDLVSIGTPRQAVTSGYSAVDFVFDKNAYVINTTGFDLVLNSQASNVNGSTGGVPEEQCITPATNSSSTTQPSGQTNVGGNGTTTITVLCQNTISPNTTLTVSGANSIARGVVQPNTVSTVAQGSGTGSQNPLQASVSPHQSGLANGSPTLTGLAMTAGTSVSSSTPDSIAYTFDQPVTINGATPVFNFYTNTAQTGTCTGNGTTTGIAGGQFGNYSAPGGASTLNGCAITVSPSNNSQVIVSFGNSNTSATQGTPGALANAVGASVNRGSVINPSGNASLGAANADDEMGMSNTTPSSSTAAYPYPLLTKFHLVTSNLGTTAAQFTFSENVDNTVLTPGGLHAYDSAGDVLTCQAGAESISTSSGSQNVVTCGSFVQGGSPSGATLATSSQLSSITLGAVDYNTVKGGQSAPNTQPNPEADQPAT